MPLRMQHSTRVQTAAPEQYTTTFAHSAQHAARGRTRVLTAASPRRRLSTHHSSPYLPMSHLPMSPPYLPQAVDPRRRRGRRRAAAARQRKRGVLLERPPDAEHAECRPVSHSSLARGRRVSHAHARCARLAREPTRGCIPCLRRPRGSAALPAVVALVITPLGAPPPLSSSPPPQDCP